MALVLLAMNVLTVPTMAETENGDETAMRQKTSEQVSNKRFL